MDTPVLILSPYLLSMLIGYLLGAFPTGYWVGKLWNVDVRKHGSGRTGGTNVLRTVGRTAFVLTMTGDIAKGMVAVLFVKYLYPSMDGAHVLSVLAVLTGHIWSIWLALFAPDPAMPDERSVTTRWQRLFRSGRGGAGIAATAGAGLALYMPVGLVMIPFFCLSLAATRYASVASLTVATLYPLVTLYFVLNFGEPWSYFLLAVAASVVIIVVHVPNIRRLRMGTERRFGERSL